MLVLNKDGWRVIDLRRDKAEQAMRLLTSASSQVAEALEIFREEVDTKDFPPYAKATGDVLGWIGYHLMRPICREYPELDPDAEDEQS